VFDGLVRAYDSLGGWENRVALYLTQFPANVSMNLGGELPEERESLEVLTTLRTALDASHGDLEGIAD
jgi:hypothetical protein